MQSQNGKGLQDEKMMQMTASIVSAYVSNNQIPSGELPQVIKTVHTSLVDLVNAETGPEAPPSPAVPVEASITPDHIICLEDGRQLKMLKRYLRSRYNLTPDEYRTKWSLPADYPMVAPNYAKRRSQFAKDIGLGRKKSVA